MTVKNLITQLLDLPMDSEVFLSVQNRDKNIGFEYFILSGVVDYEDGEVGIIAELEDQE